MRMTASIPAQSQRLFQYSAPATYSHYAGFGDDNARDKLAIPPRFSEPMGKKGVQ